MRRFRVLILALLVLASPAAAMAAEVRVMISAGFTAAFEALVPEYERATGDRVVAVQSPSMGTSPTSMPSRLARGEPADVLILVDEAMDGLIAQGWAEAGSRTSLAVSRIGLSVRAGAPKPDISTVDALRRILLQAKSIAYSDSASGTYIEREMFARLGIADQVRAKSRMIVAEPVAAVVARGDAEIGFQQISALMPVAGAQFVGPIPEPLQKVTIFSAAVAKGATQPERARALIAFLASPAARPAVVASGLDPSSMQH